jgi:hypothetical protein
MALASSRPDLKLRFPGMIGNIGHGAKMDDQKLPVRNSLRYDWAETTGDWLLPGCCLSVRTVK